MSRYSYIDDIYIAHERGVFSYSDGDAIEDYLLQLMKEAGDTSTGSAALAGAICDWPTLYHLSPARADLLRPLAEQLRGRRVLEIGCGCGVMTRYLGELGCEVLALEGSHRRARITRQRCAEMTNVRVVCDNFAEFEWDEKFDVVLLIGVLEYSRQFVQGSNPPLEMLRRARRMMADGGQLVLAIENRLGLKYFAGAPEDHTGQVFDGIEDRYTPSTAVTFGRAELSSLLAAAGLGTGRFLYPFPDYKLPEVILTEEAFAAGEELSLLNLLQQRFDYPHGTGQAMEFSPDLAAGVVLKNGLMRDLANSFLVVAGDAGSGTGAGGDADSRPHAGEAADSQTHAGEAADSRPHAGEDVSADTPLVYSYNSGRRRCYCKSNLIVRDAGGGLRVARQRLYPDAPYPDEAPLAHHITDETLLPGRLLSAQAIDIVTRDGWTLADLAVWAGVYYRVLRAHVCAVDGGGSLLIPGHLLDLTPFNILITAGGEAKIFDQEWVTEESIPLFFLFFRGLVYTLEKVRMYARPGEGTPTELIPLVQALVNRFQPLDNARLEECVRLEEKYFVGIPLLPGRTFGQGELRLKNDWRNRFRKASVQLDAARKTLQEMQGQLNTAREQAHQQLADAEDRHRRSEFGHSATRLQLQQQMARIHQDHQSHVGILHQQLDWYRRTYEQRSLAGVLLQRRLTAARADGKYLTAFLLASMQEKGVSTTMGLVIRALNARGIKGWLSPRTALLPLMRGPLQVMPGAAPSAKPIYVLGDPAQALDEIKGFGWQPKISLIMPVYNTDARWLQAAVDSIRAQWYESWELCIADDGSTDKGTLQVLRRLEGESRIRIVRHGRNAGISEASNAAMREATGEFLALMDHDDELTPDALFQIVKDLNMHGEADILYTDECKVDEEGRLSDAFYKPAFSPELLLNMMYPGHLTVYRTRFLFDTVGQFRKEYDLSQDYDLMLRAVEHTTRIRHIEKVVYHWRMTAGSSAQGDKPQARASNLSALADAMRRRKIAAQVIELPTANRVKLLTDVLPMVSIIIPTDSRENLQATLTSLYTHTRYPYFEIVVVTNSRLIAEPPAAAVIPMSGESRAPVYVPYDKPYNFSDKCNAGAAAARGEVLVFFNDDVRPLQEHWLEDTIEYLSLPGVGGVSPRLIYEDDSIQYAGMASGVRGLTGTTFHGYPRDSTKYINFPQSVRNVSILSGACLAIRRTVFNETGGWDAVNTPSAHSDVDLSFKLLELGYRCVYTPYATLRHIGHLSLKAHDTLRVKDKADIYLLRRWADRIASDPYFTMSMRDHLYHDSPEPWRLIAPGGDARARGAGAQFGAGARDAGPRGLDGAAPRTAVFAAGRDVLLVSHDLSLTGAPVMLVQLCKLLQRNGYFVTVICAEDGPVGRLFTETGASLIIDSLLLRRHDSLVRFARNFDHVVCNTVVTWTVVQQLHQLTHVVWWLHEAKVIGHFTGDPDFMETLATAADVICPSDYALQHINKYRQDTRKIYYGYPDLPRQAPAKEAGEKMIFTLIGSIEPRKGQDLLVNAFRRLDPGWKEKAELWLIGRTHDEAFYEELRLAVGSDVAIKFLGERDHDECLDLMRRSDVIVCPSRDDPFPVVVVEALCLSKPCIVSSETGFARLITDGIDGFVVPNEDEAALAARIMQILKNPSTLNLVRRASRQLYQQHLTLEVFEQQFLSVMASKAAPEIGTASVTQNGLVWEG